MTSTTLCTESTLSLRHHLRASSSSLRAPRATCSGHYAYTPRPLVVAPIVAPVRPVTEYEAASRVAISGRVRLNFLSVSLDLLIPLDSVLRPLFCYPLVRGRGTIYHMGIIQFPNTSGGNTTLQEVHSRFIYPTRQLRDIVICHDERGLVTFVRNWSSMEHESSVIYLRVSHLPSSIVPVSFSVKQRRQKKGICTRLEHSSGFSLITGDCTAPYFAS